MKLLPFLAAASLLVATLASAADLNTVLAPPRKRIETADYRATGHLVKVDGSGARTNYALSLKAHYFPGVLRTLIEINGSSKSTPNSTVRILLEMRPNGSSVIETESAKGGAWSPLPLDKWADEVLGTGFSYEDFLEPQYFWAHQEIEKSDKFGMRLCDVLKSAPGPENHTHYAAVETWLDHTIGFPVYAEKTPKDSKSIKQFTYLGLRQNGGVWSANQVEVKTRGQAGSSLLIIDRGSPKANLTLKDFKADAAAGSQVQP